MTFFSHLLDFLWTLLLTLGEWVCSIVLFFMPTKLIAKDIRGQTVLVTGAAGGLGSRVARYFALKGCNLVLWDRDAELNEAIAENLKAEVPGLKVWAYTVDLMDNNAVYDLATKVFAQAGQVDILVNNAGVVYGSDILHSKDELVERTYMVNALAHIWTVKAFLPAMLQRNQGHIVTVASSAGLFGVPGMADYCGSKYAAVGFEESLRLEIIKAGKTGVKTTVICPYLIATDLFEGCKSKFPWIMDSLDPDYVAQRTVDAVLRNQIMVVIPRILYVLHVFKAILPVEAHNTLTAFFGASNLMDTYVGKQKKV